jgi:hypothetical protein
MTKPPGAVQDSETTVYVGLQITGAGNAASRNTQGKGMKWKLLRSSHYQMTVAGYLPSAALH